MAETIHTNKFLTNFATRFMPMGGVGDFIAPPFRVKRPSDKYAVYDASNLRIYDNKVKGRERAREITQDVGSANYSCEEYSLARFVSDQKIRNQDQPLDLKKDAVRHVKEAQMLAREKRVLDIAGDNSVVTQTASLASAWSTPSTATPVTNITNAIKTIWTGSYGQKANRIVMALDVALSIIESDEWKDFFKYDAASKKELFDAVQGLRNLGLEPKIAGMFGANTNENVGSDPTAESYWSDSVLIFQAQQRPTLETRTFMYSPFTMMNMIEEERIPGERGQEIRIYEEVDELLVDASSAYLYTNAL